MFKNANFFNKPKFIKKQNNKKQQQRQLELDFFLSNFIQNELPILKMKRLKKIQALFRGVYFRIKILPKILKWRKAVLQFAEYFFIKTIQQKLLNEVIFESLQECKIKNIDQLVIKQHRRSIRYTDYIIDSVCKKMSKNIIDQILKYEVNKVLNNKARKLITDPLEMIVDDLLQNICNKESKKIVKESIDDISKNLILDNKLKIIIEDNIVLPAIKNISKQVLNEILSEFIMDDILQNLENELLEPLAILTFNEERALKEDSFFEEQFQQFTDRNLQEILSNMLLEKFDECNLEILADHIVKRPSLAQQLSSGFLKEVKYLTDQLIFKTKIQIQKMDQNLKGMEIDIPDKKRKIEELSLKFKDMFKNFYQLRKIQKYLIRQLCFSSQLNLKTFQDLFQTYQSCFKAYFGDVSYDQLFKEFNEDNDQYLNEDEQLLVFSTINSKLIFFYEEFVFYGCYSYLRQTEQLREKINNLIIEFQQELRSNMYQQQLQQFFKIKDKNFKKQKQFFKSKENQFKKYRAFKVNSLKQTNNNQLKDVQNLVKTKQQQFRFCKYSQLRNMKLQEKFLCLFGNIEESTNMKKMYQKFVKSEANKLNYTKQQFEKKNINKLQATQNFKNKILKEKLIFENQKFKKKNQLEKIYLQKQFHAQENQIKKIQAQIMSKENFNFKKQSRLNLLKAQSKLKKDYMNWLKQTIPPDKLYNSTIFNTYFRHGQKKLSDIQKLRNYKNSDFNIRFHLRRGADDLPPVNLEYNNISNRENDIEKIQNIVNFNSFTDQGNHYKLSSLYDNNLDIKKTIF